MTNGASFQIASRYIVEQKQYAAALEQFESWHTHFIWMDNRMPVMSGIDATRRIRALRASEAGAYSVRGVPPGEYFIVAIPDVDLGDYPDPRMLDALSKTATRFIMAPSEHKTQDLVVKAIR